MNLIYNNKTPVGINYNSNEIETLNYNEEPVWENTPYEELEYIKGTGTQYIDTRFIPTDNTKIKLKIKDITTNDKMIISATSDWSSNRFLLTYYSNALRWYLPGEVYKRVDTNSINEVEAYRGYYKVNDEVISNDTTSKTLTNLTNIFIWGSSYLENRNNGFKLYYFQIYDNEVLIRDFIPVRRKSDGEVCLYDKVSKQFYINQGTGKFSAGPEKQPKISDFKILEYIQSTGNQFIDINYIPKSIHTKYELGFMRIATNGNWNPIINSEEDVRFGIMCTTSGSNRYNYGQFHIGSTSEFKSVQFPITDNVKYDMIADKTGISVNNTKYDLTDVPDATGQWSTCINHRKNSSSGYSSEYSLGKWYYLKIYEDNELIKDFVPAKRIYDDELGVYDRKNNNFYINNGTGQFIAGPEINQNIEDFKTLEYIQSTGTQCIDTGINPDSNTVIEIKFSWQGSNYGWGRLFGTSGDINFELAAKSNTTFRFGINGIGADVPFNGDVIQTVKVTGTGKYYLDDVLKLDRNINQNFITFLYLLCIGNASNREKGKAKIYYCKIWNNDILIKNFIPVEKKSNNEIGLYNLVDNSFYTNQGTGEFIAGEEI